METTSKCMQSYTEIINNHPLLTREEEYELVSIINEYKSGIQRQQAREKLFKSNLRLVIQQAQIFKRSTSLPLEDLIGAGIEGLGNAIDRFNPKKFKTKLSTISTFWIRLKLFQLITSFNYMVYIPRHIIEKGQKLRSMTDGDINKMTDKEIMDNLEVSELVLRNIQSARSSHVISLNTKYNNNDKDETTLEGVIADKNAKSADDIYAEKERRNLVRKYLKQLSPVEKDILCCRYMSDTKENLRDIGARLNLTGERVRQMEYKAFRKLRKRMLSKSFFEV